MLETSGHTDEARRDQILEQLKALLASAASNDTVTPALQLLAAQTFLAAGQTKEALSCVHWGVSMEQIALSLQIYLKLDRLDLAQEQLSLLKQADEEAILTQLAQVYLHICTGASAAQDAIHHLNSLSEQYGPSPLLLNLMACAYMVVGQYGLAEARLQECRTELASTGAMATPHAADTLINLIVCLQHQNKSNTDLLEDMQKGFPGHAFCQGLDRVVSAIDRESIKYRV
jgi:coatomer protein complex subunit epsilon